MRVVVWTLGLAFFVTCTVIAYLCFPLPEGPLALAELQDTAVSEAARAERIDGLRDEVRQGFGVLETLRTTELQAVAAAVVGFETSSLKKMLLAMETHSGAVEERVVARVSEVLSSGLSSEGLDFLLLVTADDRVVVAGARGEERDSSFRARLIEFSTQVFRDAQLVSGVEDLPASLAADADRRDGEHSLFLVAARPVWGRPDSPHGVLVGGKSLSGVFTSSMEKLAAGRRARFRWHVFAVRDSLSPLVVSGEDKGVLIRSVLLRELEERGESESPGLQRMGTQVGKWAVLRSTRGEVLGGWGLTVAPATVAAVVSPPRQPLSSELAPFWGRIWGNWQPRAIDVVFISGGVLLGLVFLGCLLALWTRPRTAERRSTESPTGDRDTFHRLVERLETIAEESREMFERRVEELASRAQQGERVLREELARLRKDLVGGGGHVVDPVRVRQVSSPGAKSQKSQKQGEHGASTQQDQGQLAELSQRLENLAAGLERVDDERVQREVERLEQEWERKLGELRGEVEEANALGESLVKDLEASRSEEEKLRAELEQLREAQKDMEELSRREQELSSVLDEARGKETDLSGKLLELKTELEEARSVLENTEEARSELQAQVDDLRAEQENLLAELESCKVSATPSSGKSGPKPRKVERQLEEVRRESAALADFQGALTNGNLPIATLAVDARFKVFVWNPAAESLFARSGDEVLGQQLADIDLGSTELLTAITEEAERATETSRSSVSQRRSFPLEGDREVHARIFCEPILAEDDAVHGVVVCVQNLNDLVLAERENDLQEAFQEALISSIPLALVITDARNRVIGWNLAAEGLLEVAESAALGRDLFSVEGALEKTDFREKFDSSVQEGKPARFVVHSSTDDESRFLATYSPLRSPDGETRGHVLLLEGSPTAEPQEQAVV
ncbi:MAG: PAS domain-containing protein [Planctomycetota bacterium]|nr:PAS domain-containing protein [Planctomycetota bacterium]